MSKVKKLDSDTINKIAAGEVVERPASVVKELVENAIDAGASRIEVEINNGGKSLIRVTDNGCGMSSDDAALAICRHATSKIVSVEDLTDIATLGFRGEALPTIMSVSKFKMYTRPELDELGTCVSASASLDKVIYETGCAVGTTIQVEDLFFNTPARKKFLKTSNTEGAKIHDFVVKLALSRPNITFKFINGKRNAICTPGNGSLSDTLISIYGLDLSESLLEIKFVDKNDKDFTISGFISKPNLLKSYRTWQTFIVNGRIINNRLISRAVDDAFRSMIPKSGYPLAVLNISLRSDSIDVNVHPQKTEIRFEDEGIVYRAVYSAIKHALEDKSDVDDIETEVAQKLDNVAARPLAFTSRPSSKSFDLSDTKSLLTNYKLHSQNIMNDTIFKRDDTSSVSQNNSDNFIAKHDEDSSITEVNSNASIAQSYTTSYVTKNDTSSSIAQENLDSSIAEHFQLSPIGQVDRCYIIASNEHDLFIVDQHAAHERILFDKFSSYTNQVPAQQLLIHQFIKFDQNEALIIEQNLELFSSLGFSMIPSGNDEFRLTECPVDLANGDAPDTLREILCNLPANSSQAPDQIAINIRQAFVATTACRAAIKAGQELSLRQMQILLDQLAKTAHPFTCPHGRPTIIKFSSHDLAKLFKRTGF